MDTRLLTQGILQGDIIKRETEIIVVAVPVSNLIVASRFQLESSNVFFLYSFSACCTILWHKRWGKNVVFLTLLNARSLIWMIPAAELVPKWPWSVWVKFQMIGKLKFSSSIRCKISVLYQVKRLLLYRQRYAQILWKLYAFFLRNPS